MDNDKDKLKEQLSKKTLLEIDSLIMAQKQKIGMEKDFKALSRLNSELLIMREIREQKLKESGRHIQKNAKPQAKPELKSYEDYIKSKK